MTMHLVVFLIAAACSGWNVQALGVPPNAASAFWDDLAVTLNLPVLPAHTPNFTVVRENVRYAGSSGEYTVPTHVVRDMAASGVVVAAWIESDSFDVQNDTAPMSGLNLLAPTPALAPAELPRLERYGWAWLYGCRMITISWLDCCTVTGDEYGFTFLPSADGSSATLSEWQSWVPTGHVPGRTGTSVHNFTLRWDAVYGYSVDAVTYLRINNASVSGLQAIEFLNFLAPTLMQPWPDALRTGRWGVPPSGAPLPPEVGPWPLPRSTHTVYSNDSAGTAWTGFANNILAGGEMDRYFMQTPLGGTLFAVPGGYSPGVAYSAAAAQGVGGMAQETCPAWGDQHQFVLLPPGGPGEDGFYVMAPEFAVRWAPSAVGAHALGHLTDVHASPPPAGYPYPPPRWNASNFLRIGALEDFEVEPVPLTQPLRALTFTTGRSGLSNYDYDVVSGAGRNGSAAWRVEAMAPAQADAPYSFISPVPMIPLNASTNYSLTAWVRLVAPPTKPPHSASAQLWLGLYEDDDIGFELGSGPSYGRLAYFNSTIITTGGGARAGGAWVSQAVTGGAPLWRHAHQTSKDSADMGGRAAEADGWTLLSISFTSPPWASYADVRPIVVSEAANATTDYALYDDWSFLPA